MITQAAYITGKSLSDYLQRFARQDAENFLGRTYDAALPADQKSSSNGVAGTLIPAIRE